MVAHYAQNLKELKARPRYILTGTPLIFVRLFVSSDYGIDFLRYNQLNIPSLEP